MTGFLRFVFVVAVLVTLGIAVQQSYRVTLKLQDPLGGHINDFDRWMLMTPAFVHGHADYVNDRLPTPPLSLLILAPFSALSRPLAQFLWVCVKLPLASAVFVLALAIVRRCRGTLTQSALVLIVAAWWLPVVLDMQEGQVNLVALLPLMGGLYLAQDERPRTDAGAGLLIGLAIAVKVTPAIFAAYFLWKRRWIVALSSVAGAVFWLVAVPAAVFGWEQNLRWLGEWGRIMIVPYVTRGTVVYAISQSFGSFALRLLTAVPVFETRQDGIVQGHYMNLFSFSADAVYQFVRVVMAAVVGVGLVWMRHRLLTLRSPRYLVEIGAVAAFMLWFSERTWVHHYVSFLLMLCAAGAMLSDTRQSRRSQRVVQASLLLFSIATLGASEAGRMLGPDGVDWAKGAGVFLWPSVFVTVAVSLRWTPRPQERTAAGLLLPLFGSLSGGGARAVRTGR